MTDGEHEAVERVWVEHGPRLWRSLLAFTADADVASDALAETFALMLARPGEIREPAGWAWRVASNWD